MATEQLAAAGVGSPRVDAELLLAHVLQMPRTRLLTAEVDDAAGAAFAAAVQRRATREPLQHITGQAPFRHILVKAGPGVFVPRPETELLVDAVLPMLRRPGAVAVDLCAGTGALALAIADEAADAAVHAVEHDAAALAWLRRNAAETRVQVVAGDVRDAGLLAALHGSVDAVVSNPPYVPKAVAVAPEVRADPAAAVFAGPDGLALIPHVIARASDLLRPGGLLALEHDDTHEDAVPRLLAADSRWRDVAEHRDLAGRPRYATAVRA